MLPYRPSPTYPSSKPARDAARGTRRDAQPQCPPIPLLPRPRPPAAPKATRGSAAATGRQWDAHSSSQSTNAIRVENTARSSLSETPSIPACASIPRYSRGALYGSLVQTPQNDDSTWLPSHQSPTSVSYLLPSSNRKQLGPGPRAFCPLD